MAHRMPCARALYGFRGQSAYELDFNAGVSILLLRRIDENWLEGKLEGKVGIFPANLVKIEVGSPSVDRENALANSGKPYALALHPFLGTQAGDLSFSKGDLIELLGNITSNTGWMKGKLDDSTGIFPASFVEVLRYPETEKIITETEVEFTDNDNGGEAFKPTPKPRSYQSKQPAVAINNYQMPIKSDIAPPTANSSNCKTLPRPKPRKIVRSNSSSSKIGILQSELAIEMKLLESAENLFVASQSEARNEKMNKAIATHKSNIALLHEAIVEAKECEEAEVAAASTKPPSLPPPLPPPPQHTLPISTKEQYRTKIINELVYTERDFHHQMKLCSSKLLPALREIPDIQSEVLFGNIEEVTDLSGDLLVALEEACKEKQASVGNIFLSFAPRMKAVYGVYCRNHDSAAALYEKYMDTRTTADNIHHCMDVMRGDVQAWDFQSLLIKPVQRVLKYPLLLEKLVKATPDSHSDSKMVHSAQEAIARVAQDINEIKRRKDLVVKYTGFKEERRGTMSIHSLQKKVKRFQQTFTQITGLRSKTIDPRFDELEQKVISLDSLIRTLLKDIANWQDELQHVVNSRVTLMEGMVLYCSNPPPSLQNYQSFLSQFQQAIKSQAKFVKDHVSSPLETLNSLFQNPFHLIQKRRDKLLDYDHTQYALDRAEDSDKIAQLKEDLLLAKRNYEALNTQLLEELPSFIDLVVKMLQYQLTVLVQAQYSFFASVSELLPPLLSHPQLITASSEIIKDHAEKLTLTCRDLAKLSIVPASLAMNFCRSSESSSSSQDNTTDSHASGEMAETKEEGGTVEENLTAEKTTLRVLYDFEAQDVAELSVSANNLLVLLCPHDKIGCEEWWLVQDLQGNQGYVPATYLTKCSKGLH